MMGELPPSKKQCAYFDEDDRISINMDFVLKNNFVEWCRQTFGHNGGCRFSDGEVVTKWLGVHRAKVKGRIHYHMRSSAGRPKTGLLGCMDILTRATSPCLCFVFSLASLMAFDPPTGHYLFGNCNQAKHQNLKKKS